MAEKPGATASSNSPTLLELWQAIGTKLMKMGAVPVPSKQLVARSSRARDASRLTRATAFSALSGSDSSIV